MDTIIKDGFNNNLINQFGLEFIVLNNRLLTLFVIPTISHKMNSVKMIESHLGSFTCYNSKYFTC
jgi:hypothetical protein